MRAPERTDTEIEKQRDDAGCYPERSVVAGMRVGYDGAPKRGSEDDDGQEKEDAADFEPENAAHATKGAQKAAYAAADGSTGLAHRLPNLMCRAGCRLACTVLLRGANWNRLMHLRSARGLRGRRQELPDNVPGNAHSDAQGTANHARSHPVYDGSSGLWRVGPVPELL